MGCGLCVETCAVGCRGMKIVEPSEYLPEAAQTGGMGVSVENLMEVTACEKAEREAKKEK